MAEEAVETQETLPISVEQVAPEAKPARTTRRRRTTAAAEAPASGPAPEEQAPGGGEEAPASPKRRRGRPRKADAEAGEGVAEPSTAPVQDAASANQGGDSAPAEQTAEAENKTRRRRLRTRKDGAEAPDVDEMTKMTQNATVASAQITEPPAVTLAEADARAAGEQPPAETQTRRRRRGSQNNQQAQAQQQAPKSQGNQQQGQGKRSQSKRRNRRGQEASAEPTLTREEREAMKVAELRAKAAELGVDYVGVRKKELVEGIYHAAARAEGFRPVTGVLEMQSDGYAFLRTGNYMPGEQDAFVHQQIILNYGLRPGDKIVGQVAPSRTGNKYPPLHRIDTVNGRSPEGLKERPRFRDLTPIYPDERLVMEHGKDSTTGRAIDLVAPIGKGQRGLIVSPPKAGKTTVLKRICQSIAANNPEVHLFCLLVDERPEEVTDMERSIRGEVVASTFDMPADNHTAVAELVIEHAKRLVEQGEDVVVVLDSITRLARAYNLAAPASGRILSGGVDSAALYPPKKFLGAARNIENGGSLTILASALIDTGSKMDEVIFEEFKGTGNMELKLDRDLADKRIFPAIDPVASGTRNEDLLIDAEMQPFVWGIRRVLANMNSVERAATALVKGLKATNTNQEFLIRSAKKAQQSGDYLG